MSGPRRWFEAEVHAERAAVVVRDQTGSEEELDGAVFAGGGDGLRRAWRGLCLSGDRRLPPALRAEAAAICAVHALLLCAARADRPDRAGEPLDRGAVLLWLVAEGGSEEADRAFWESAVEAGGAVASPLGFAATLPSSIAGEVTRVLGLTGPAVVVVEASGGPPRAAFERAGCTAVIELHIPRSPDASVRGVLTGVRD